MCCHALSRLAGNLGNWLSDSLLVRSNAQLDHTDMLYVRAAGVVFREMVQMINYQWWCEIHSPLVGFV